MGEIADELMDRYFGGEPDDWDEDPEPGYERRRACRYCGSTNVIWFMRMGKGWVLCDNETGDPHQCPRVSPDSFEDFHTETPT